MKVYLFLIPLPFILWACANQTQPTGGPKDKEPPYVTSSSPQNASLNFKGQSIELDFNEMIKQDNLQKKLIITPSLKGKYKVKIIRNKLTLNFDSPFQDSTTYTFNFRDGIKDVTESNPAKDLFLVFSTGNHLDSLSIKGKVSSLLSAQFLQDYTVGLYDPADTVNFLNGPPIYATLTDKAGNYQFRNIKQGSYLIAAFKDKNSNLICQTQSEPYGYLIKPIQVDSSLSSINLKTQFLDLRKFIIISARPSGKYFEVRMNKPIIDYSISMLSETSTKDSLYRNLTSDNRVLRFYNTFSQDSLPVILNAVDSAGFKVSDTISIKFQPTSRPSEPFNVKVASSTVKIPTRQMETTFNFNKPLKEFNLDSLSIAADSLNFSLDSLSPSLSWNQKELALTLTLTLNDSILQHKNLSIVTQKSTFISIENDTTKQIKTPIKPMNPDNFGILSVQLDSPLSSFIIQLIDAKENIVAERKNSSPAKFEYINAGKYKIRLMIDQNGNGIWDPGNYIKATLPEPVLIYFDTDAKTDVITVKNNWVLGPYNLSTKPQK